MMSMQMQGESIAKKTIIGKQTLSLILLLAFQIHLFSY